MPLRIFAIDTNFPTFTGEESPVEQIKLLHNYMFQLQENLQYTLRNLTPDNFNTKGLEELSEQTSGELREQLKKVLAECEAINTKLNGFSTQLSGQSGQIKDLREDVDDLTDQSSQIEALQADMDAVKEAIQGEDGLWQRSELAQEEIEKLKEQLDGEGGVEERLALLVSALQVAEDGTMTLGSEDKPLKLIGQIYINGELYGGITDETP